MVVGLFARTTPTWSAVIITERCSSWMSAHNESFPEDACWSPVGVHRTNVIEGEWDVYYGGAGTAEEVTMCLQLFHFHIALDPSQFHLHGMLFWFRSFRDAPKGYPRLT